MGGIGAYPPRLRRRRGASLTAPLPLAVLDGSFTGPDRASPYDHPHHDRTVLRQPSGPRRCLPTATSQTWSRRSVGGLAARCVGWDTWRRASTPPWPRGVIRCVTTRLHFSYGRSACCLAV